MRFFNFVKILQIFRSKYKIVVFSMKSENKIIKIFSDNLNDNE